MIFLNTVYLFIRQLRNFWTRYF